MGKFTTTCYFCRREGDHMTRQVEITRYELPRTALRSDTPLVVPPQAAIEKKIWVDCCDSCRSLPSQRTLPMRFSVPAAKYFHPWFELGDIVALDEDGHYIGTLVEFTNSAIRIRVLWYGIPVIISWYMYSKARLYKVDDEYEANRRRRLHERLATKLKRQRRSEIYRQRQRARIGV